MLPHRREGVARIARRRADTARVACLRRIAESRDPEPFALPRVGGRLRDPGLPPPRPAAEGRRPARRRGAPARPASLDHCVSLPPGRDAQGVPDARRGLGRRLRASRWSGTGYSRAHGTQASRAGAHDGPARRRSTRWRSSSPSTPCCRSRSASRTRTRGPAATRPPRLAVARAPGRPMTRRGDGNQKYSRARDSPGRFARRIADQSAEMERTARGNGESALGRRPGHRRRGALALHGAPFTT